MEGSSDAAGGKRHQEWIEATLEPVHTYIEDSSLAALSREHREYLAQRHSTLDLDPIPDANDADPYNWPQSRVSKVKVPLPRLRRFAHDGVESYQPDSRRLPRYDGHLYRRLDPVCV